MRKSNVKKNFMYQMIYEVLILVLPFATSPYIARVLGAERVGIYSYTYSIAYYFYLFSLLGIKNYGNRAIARVRDNQEELNKCFANIYAVHLLVSIVCLALYMGYILLFAKGYKLYSLIQTPYVISALLDISWFFFGIEKFKLTVTRNTIIRLINVACIFIFVRTADDLWKYCLILALGQMISQASLWFFIRREVEFVKPKWKEMQVHVKPLFVLFIPAVAVSLYKYMDKIMLGSMSTKIQLGLYENAEKVITIPTTVIGSFGTVMLPKMSNLAVSGKKDEVGRYMKLSMRYVMCLAFALAFGLSGVAINFASLFWGMEFTYSGNLIMALSITIPFTAYANVIRTQYLIPREHDKEYIISVSLGAAVNLIINGIMITNFGAMGAAIGTIFAEATVCLIQVFCTRKELPQVQYIKSALPFFFIGATMFIGVFFVGQRLGTKWITLALQILIGAVYYCLMCGIYFIATKDKLVMAYVNKFLCLKRTRH